MGLFPETASQYSSAALNELQAVLSLDLAGEAGNYCLTTRSGVTDYIHMLRNTRFSVHG